MPESRILVTGAGEFIGSHLTEPRRDFAHVDDVAEAFIAALRFRPSGFEAFNIGSGSSKSVCEIVSLVMRLSGGTAKVSYTYGSRRGGISEVVADVSKAERLLGWAPRITLEEGIRTLLVEEDGR